MKHQCGNDPEHLRSIGARFVDVVYPGDSLEIAGWQSGSLGTYRFRAANQLGKQVLDYGKAEVI